MGLVCLARGWMLGGKRGNWDEITFLLCDLEESDRQPSQRRQLHLQSQVNAPASTTARNCDTPVYQLQLQCPQPHTVTSQQSIPSVLVFGGAGLQVWSLSSPSQLLFLLLETLLMGREAAWPPLWEVP